MPRMNSGKMGRKSKNEDDTDFDVGRETGKSASTSGNSKSELLPSMIKNKAKRSEIYTKIKRDKKVEKKKKVKARDAAESRALELGQEPPARQVPRTIENTREANETVCQPDDEERGPAFISELLQVIPNAHHYKRGTYDLKKIVEYAKKRDFTSIIVVHTNRRAPGNCRSV